ncbi:HypC/HybG/HupF family hydrogenase formation chaperone [Synechococcus sp. J7-Johnson]|uniref:HypC/HybG/HupF family hydrogenase formation chaperone n=1 Tax=Synechococcus sp. J7-Johnson TaxID=2823737 RepID=UPI0020CD0A41|nr:HypC/HybG/HupF family hydrogenase formation chaperone [Synechococcus sp. J7-Johnson]MCP9840754.1 HypC/HybG/HupF family hydrogenase formation chaperone [Synechococcus sp. J7-Johnson]
MCLAVPGLILSITSRPPQSAPEQGGQGDCNDDIWRMADVDFGGVRQQVSLACLPDAQVGDQVLVHVGMALSLVEEEEA